ncbi:hypothetical protein [Streptomyces decoyicus]|uniref:hypothetical protein n=1 Tax=Streptomyces decoyicus TaxID=249567 RepID=UPI0037FB7B36
MSTDQAEAASSTVDEAPAPEPAAPARGVDDFLADLDEVLATSTAPTIPAPAAEPDPESDAAATMPDVDLALDVAGPAAAPTPAPAAPAKDWWNDVYQDDAADQDTFTGNIPAAAPAPAPVATPPNPSHAPDALGDQDQDDVDKAEDAADEDGDDQAPAKKWWLVKKKSADDVQDDEVDEDCDEAPAPTGKTGGQFTAAVKNAGPVVHKSKGGGLVNNPRGRQVLFAGTAYAMGWGLGWDDRLTDLMAQSAHYAIPVTGCALGAGVLGLATGTKFGGVVFVSSLALLTALTMADPARVVGGGVAVGCHIAYRFFRRWVGHYRDKWPWKGVVWAAHVPAATATVAFLLYGTN